MEESNKINLEELLNQAQSRQQQLDDYDKLFNVLQTICSTMEVSEILAHIIDEAIKLCNAQEGSILLFDPKSKELAKTIIRKADTGETLLDHYMNTLLTGWILHHSSILLTDDLVNIFGEKRIKTKYQNITSVLSIPLALHGEILGVVNLITCDQQHKFGERGKRLMEVLASLCTQFIVNVRLHESLFAETQRLRKEVQGKYAFHGVIGNSPKMQEVFSLLERIVPTDGRILLEGESGTGKELIARVIHYGGPRKDGHFVAVDCGALPVNLLESELFGYVKGAFTGADRDKKGLFEEADEGTLFLDEIANMPSEIQAKFLRVIQEGEIRPLGSTQAKKVDVRIIAASSENLRDRIKDGIFREDLFYRLNVVNITLPPLRERREDIAILANNFLKKLSERHCKKILGFKSETISILEDYSWPGNVRELENIVERMIILADQNLEYLPPELLPAEIRSNAFESNNNISLNNETSQDMNTMIATYEKKLLLNALKKHHWNQSSAARELGVNEKTVRDKMKKYHIKKHSYK